jgi:hypothetical protein
VVDVRNDAEIADVLGIHGLFSGGAAPPAAMPPRLVRANHAFQTSEFAIHRGKIEIWPSAQPASTAFGRHPEELGDEGFSRRCSAFPGGPSFRLSEGWGF